MKSYSFSPGRRPLRGVTSCDLAWVSGHRRGADVSPDAAKLEPRLAGTARASSGNPTAFCWNQTVPSYKTGHKVQLVKHPKPHQQTSQEAQLPTGFPRMPAAKLETQSSGSTRGVPRPGGALPLVRAPVPQPQGPAPPHSHTTTVTNALRLPAVPNPHCGVLV